MKKIKLNVTQNNNLFALVDKDDYHKVSSYNWYAHREKDRIYVYTNIKVGENRTCIKMHRLILGNPEYMVDHINRNGLDNRKSNLRRCNKSQNAMNSKIQSNNKSGYRGVSFDKSRKKWVAQLKFHGKKVFRKRYNKLTDAVEKYNEMARKYHGEFFKFNKL